MYADSSMWDNIVYLSVHILFSFFRNPIFMPLTIRLYKRQDAVAPASIFSRELLHILYPYSYSYHSICHPAVLAAAIARVGILVYTPTMLWHCNYVLTICQLILTSKNIP